MKTALTHRLIQLNAATRTEIADCFENPELVAQGLGACAAPDWGEGFYDEAAPYVVDAMAEGDVGWWYWWVTETGTPPTPVRQLVGFAGFKGPPTRGGSVELTYGLAPRSRGRGLCTSSVELLLEWAFRFPNVSRVIATIDPDNHPSQSAVGKCGLTLRENESDEELLVFVIERAARARGARPVLSAKGTDR